MNFERRLIASTEDIKLTNAFRIIRSRYSAAPLGNISSESRYCDGQDPKYYVIYLAESLTTAFAEVFVRGNFWVSFRPGGVTEKKRIVRFSDMADRSVALINSHPGTSVRLVNLQGAAPAFLGLHTDTSRGATHKKGRQFARYVYENYADIDGFVWDSRHTSERCYCLFDRVSVVRVFRNAEVFS